MIYCSQERCATCDVVPEFVGCLQQQAQHFAGLSETVFSKGLSEAFEAISMELVDEASLLAKRLLFP